MRNLIINNYPTQTSLGDLNEDGTINIQDIILIIGNILGTISLSDVQLELGDLFGIKFRRQSGHQYNFFLKLFLHYHQSINSHMQQHPYTYFVPEINVKRSRSFHLQNHLNQL